MNQERNIKDGPFAYQVKATIRILREHFDDSPKMLTSALAIYLVLTELASNAAKNKPTEIFTVTHGVIALYAGLSRRTVIELLTVFESIGIISVERRSDGKLKLSNHYTLLATPIIGSNVKVEKEQDAHIRITKNNRKKNKKNENNKENKEEINKRSTEEYSDEFLQLWEAYPRKVGKQAAYKAFLKVNPDAKHLKKMIETIELWKNSKQWKKDNGQFIPHPQTWLNGGRWDDILSKDEFDPEDDEEDYNETYRPRGGW